MPRVGKDLFRRAAFDGGAAAEDECPVTGAGQGDIVRDDDLQSIPEGGKELLDIKAAAGGVQPVRGFIRDDQTRLIGSGERQNDLLRHAAGDLKRIERGNERGIKPGQTETFLRACFPEPAGEAETPAALIKVPTDSLRGIEGIEPALRDIDKRSPEKAAAGAPGEGGKIGAVQSDTETLRTDIGREEAEDGHGQHGFARAGLADEGKRIIAVQTERDILQDAGRARRERTNLIFQCGHRDPPSMIKCRRGAKAGCRLGYEME